mgnify:CR=1 FL=1
MGPERGDADRSNGDLRRVGQIPAPIYRSALDKPWILGTIREIWGPVLRCHGWRAPLYCGTGADWASLRGASKVGSSGGTSGATKGFVPLLAPAPGGQRVEPRMALQEFDAIDRRLTIIEQHLRTLASQLDSIHVLVSRSYTGQLKPEAVIASVELAKKDGEALEAELNAELEERAARGIGNDGDAVTEEDIRNWESDRILE